MRDPLRKAPINMLLSRALIKRSQMLLEMSSAAASSNQPVSHTPLARIMFLSFSFPGRVECENSGVLFLRKFYSIFIQYGVWRGLTCGLFHLSDGLYVCLQGNHPVFSDSRPNKGHFHGEHFPDQGTLRSKEEAVVMCSLIFK